jgi:hypothetical protein
MSTATPIVERLAPTSVWTAVAALPLAVIIGVGVGLASPIEGAALAHIIVGGVAAFAVLSRRPDAAESVGVGLYITALLLILFILNVFVWPLFSESGAPGDVAVLGGIVLALPVAVIVAGVVVGVGYLIINYS